LEEGDLLYMPSALPGLSAEKASGLLQLTDRLIKTVPEAGSVAVWARPALPNTVVTADRYLLVLSPPWLRGRDGQLRGNPRLDNTARRLEAGRVVWRA
jgi:hypothetical protein